MNPCGSGSATGSTISPMFKGALMLTMKDAQASEIQVSERQAKHVRELLQI